MALLFSAIGARMTEYIHDLAEWPAFHWQDESIATLLASVRHRQGCLIGRMESLGFALRDEAILRTLTEDVLKSSDIEGEVLGPRPGPLIDCAPPWHGYRRAFPR